MTTDHKAQVEAAREECKRLADKHHAAWDDDLNRAIDRLAAFASSAPVLTDERIVDIARSVDSDACDQSQTMAFARAIEAEVRASPAPAVDIDAAAQRLMMWPLPKDFGPDCGISFDGRKDDEWNKNKTWPVGTNLFSVEQAKKMLEYVLAGSSPAPVVPERDSITLTARQILSASQWAAPDGEAADEDQLDSEWVIGWTDGVPNEDHDLEVKPGYVMWLSDYPEEGCLPLDTEDDPTAPPAPAASEPVAGWKLVPAHPSQEQVDEAFMGSCLDVTSQDCRDIYQLMLKYAPQPPAASSDALDEARISLSARITSYLAGGGLFNPEMADHDAVRDLLIDCRAYLDNEPPPFRGSPVIEDSFRAPDKGRG